MEHEPYREPKRPTEAFEPKKGWCCKFAFDYLFDFDDVCLFYCSARSVAKIEGPCETMSVSLDHFVNP